MQSEFALPPDLQTPALVVDERRVRANVARLQTFLDGRAIALTPHVKTHKSVAIARLQIEAGARGLAVGTLGEAEVFADAGFDDLFLAYPIWASGPKADRLRRLAERVDLRVGVDSIEAADRLATAVVRADIPLRVVIEIDPGNRRTGVAGPAAAAAVAEAARSAGLEVVGVFAHAGHSYRPDRVESAATDEVASLEAAAVALEARGFEVGTISAGSTPTMQLAATGRVNEMRAGTYALGDRQQWLIGAIPAEGCAAVVAATIVSVHRDRVVLDAGAKALTKDRAEWIVGHGHIVGYPDAVIERLADYHGIVTFPGGAARPALGEVVAVIPNHICPVVDLFDAFTMITRDGSTESLPVDARGRSS